MFSILMSDGYLLKKGQYPLFELSLESFANRCFLSSFGVFLEARSDSALLFCNLGQGYGPPFKYVVQD